MAQSLGELLDKARGAREVLPHLAALERGLLEHGLGAVERVPDHWLGRICSQLSSLPLPEQDPPLHELLQCLMSRLRAQPAAESDWINDPNGGFHPERTVVIREISHSEFAAASEENLTTIRLPLP
jgi:hypothetical protein